MILYLICILILLGILGFLNIILKSYSDYLVEFQFNKKLQFIDTLEDNINDFENVVLCFCISPITFVVFLIIAIVESIKLFLR